MTRGSRRGDGRSVPGNRRRTLTLGERLRRHWDVLAMVLAIVTLIGVVGVFTVGKSALADDAPEAGGAASAATDAGAEPVDSATEIPAEKKIVRTVGKVVDGLHLAHIPKPAELIATMQNRGYELTDPEASDDSMDFNVASFNILGANHHRKGFANGVTRMGPALARLQYHGVSVAGLQESQEPQINSFLARTGGSWGIYPGNSLGRGIVAHNSIVWNKGEWTLIEARTSPIPYFGGRPAPMPHILLEHNDTGQRVWFGNYHNPADVRGPAARWRAQAIAREAALARDLTADGTPMIITGDMNDRAPFACPFTQASGMHSADGAYYDGDCHLPQRMNVDWVMGSSDIDFSGFVADFSTKARKIADHPLIKSTASIAIEPDLSDCVRRTSTDGKLLFCPN